jgi:hypothetical protein
MTPVIGSFSHTTAQQQNPTSNLTDSELLEVEDQENLAFYTQPVSNDNSFTGMDSSLNNSNNLPRIIEAIDEDEDDLGFYVQNMR